MDDRTWNPTNEPSDYNAARVAALEPIQQAIQHLQLPPIRLRKLNAIRNALEMQIEDGGDSPEVNNRLVDALRLAVIHQVGQQRAGTVLEAIDNFAQAEDLRWKQAQAQTQPLTQNPTTSVTAKNTGQPRRKFRSGRKKRKKR